MATPKIVNQGATTMYVDENTTRKTAKPVARSFGGVMGQVADVALRGVEVGATVVGGPLVGAAVRGVRVGAAQAGVTGASAGPLSTGGAAGGEAGVVDQGAAQENGTLNEVRAMQEQAQEFNLQYLALQENVQQDNRRFTTVSNVLKAKHDTSKGAINNIHS
jgi:hypothetical protein